MTDPPCPTPRCVAPIRVDGGTTFGGWTDEGLMAPQFRWWLELVQADPGEEEDSRRAREGWVTRLPMGPGFDEEESPCGDTIVAGVLRDRITWHCADRCYLTLKRSTNATTGEQRWYIRAQAKARELYARDAAGWISKWLDNLGSMLGIEEWSTTVLHLNSDFANFELSPQQDMRCFLGARKQGAQGVLSRHARALADGSLQWMSTTELGTKMSDVQLVCYRKCQQLRQAKRTQPTASMYAPLWLSNGWNGVDEITRVEFRCRKKGLFYVDKASGEEVDFHDPKSVANPETLARLWSRLAHSRRLTVPETDPRKTRQDTDPRWLPVQAASRVDGRTLRQVDRRVRKLTDRERQVRDFRRVLMGVASMCTRDGLISNLGGFAVDRPRPKPYERERWARESYARVQEAMRLLASVPYEEVCSAVDEVMPTSFVDALRGLVDRIEEQRQFAKREVDSS